MTGNYYTSDGNHFKTTYQGTARNPASQMSYDDPVSGTSQNVTINTFVSARFAITIHDENGNSSVVEQNGVLIQMSNGDLFFRPSVDTVNDWNGITRISQVEVLSATRIDNTVATIGFNASIFETDVVCFTRDTLIACPDGLRPVQDLKPGDLVLTRDDGAQPIRWIGSRTLSGGQLAQRLRPIRIRAGALGQGLPERDLLVSPQHRVLVRSNIAQRMFGASEVLVAAKQLLLLDGIDIADDLAEVEYIHFIFDRHQIVLSNGAETESLYPGPEALKTVGQAARHELFALFPQLNNPDIHADPVRTLLSGRQGRRLAMRHAQNSKPLLNARLN